MARYISQIKATISKESLDSARANNQVVITGNNETYPVSRGIFFIEHVEAAAGTTITIIDGSGVTMAAGVSAFSNDYSPLRCDNGIEITGNVAMLKGFILRSVLP